LFFKNQLVPFLYPTSKSIEFEKAKKEQLLFSIAFHLIFLIFAVELTMLFKNEKALGIKNQLSIESNHPIFNLCQNKQLAFVQVFFTEMK